MKSFRLYRNKSILKCINRIIDEIFTWYGKPKRARWRIIAVIYKNAQNIYKIPLYRLFCPVVSCIFSFVLDNRIDYLLLKFSFSLLRSLVCVLSIWRAYSLTRSVINAKSIKTYITQKEATVITKSLLQHVSQSTARYLPSPCPESEGRRKPTLSRAK